MTNTRPNPRLKDLRHRREDIRRIAAKYGASNVRVFGSVASDEADSDSDIDFLVDLQTDARGFAFFGALEDLRSELDELLGCRVDVAEAIQPHARSSVERDTVEL